MKRSARFYRAASVCLVTALHDGMNLVAKEFVAARNDNQGVLILSTFAGAALELSDALLVNPYDVQQVAGAILRGLEMSSEEQATRMEHLRANVRENNVYRWGRRSAFRSHGHSHRYPGTCRDAMTPAARGALPLLSNWNQVAEKIRKHPHGPLVIFLDFDGTLVDIAPRPQMVRLKPAARRILQKLSRHRRVRIVMISGRRRAELLHFIGIRGIRYFGLYGWESGTGALLPSRSTAVLQRALRVLEDRLRPYPTAWIENKKSSLSIHLLDVPAQQQIQIRSKLRAWLKPFRKSLRVEANLRDVEILPRSVSGQRRRRPPSPCRAEAQRCPSLLLRRRFLRRVRLRRRASRRLDPCREATYDRRSFHCPHARSSRGCSFKIGFPAGLSPRCEGFARGFI